MKEELEELTDALWMIREREKMNRQSQDEKTECVKTATFSSDKMHLPLDKS